MTKRRVPGQPPVSQLELPLSMRADRPPFSAPSQAGNVIAFEPRSKSESIDRLAVDRILSFARGLPRQLD